MSNAPARVLPRVAVVGVHGYGASHVMAALRLQELGALHLSALVDPRPGPITREGRTLDPADLPPFAPTLAALLAGTDIDVVVIATPLHTHADLARQALAAGADVLLEKPPVTNSADLASLLAAEQGGGARVQVGFQSLGSLALGALRAAMRQGQLGAIERMGAFGSWTRDRAYWQRAPWAGRRQLDGIEVGDGAVTNPFAHAVMGALALADRTSAAGVGAVEVDLYRVNDIEADDTSSLRVGGVGPVDGAGGVGSIGVGGTYDGPVTGVFTLAGPSEQLPYIEVVGSEAVARLYYTQDRIETDAPDHPVAGTYARRDLLEDLLEARRHGSALIAPLADMAGFVKVVEAVRATQPRRIPDRFVRWVGRGSATHPVLDGIDDVMDRALASSCLFHEVGAPWAC